MVPRIIAEIVITPTASLQGPETYPLAAQASFQRSETIH
jgi:hypothetical protein